MALKNGLGLRDVILAAVAAFIAWGWTTYYLPTLRFLPQAFFAGFVAAIGLVLYAILTTARRQDEDTPALNRHFAFTTPQIWPVERQTLRQRLDYRPKDLYPSSRAVSKSLENLLSLIERDFIEVWYSNISKRPTFTNEVDRAIRFALANILVRTKMVDLVGQGVSRVLPIVTSHMSETYNAEKAVRGRKLSKSITESEELDLAIATKFRNGRLHVAASLAFADTKATQQQYLKGVVMRLLPKLLPPKLLSSAAVTTLIKEIVACAVLQPIVQVLSDPDTWNQLLEAYGKTMLQERKTVRRLRAALDEHAPTSPSTQRLAPIPKLAASDSDRQFEKFVRAIRQCNNLSDARRFRSEIAGQIVRETAVDDQDPLFLRRLETGKRILDQKIAIMGTRGSSAQKPKSGMRVSLEETLSVSQPRSALETATLKEILYSATGLSSFMEFMDRLGLMRLVQFWIVVDGFRNPLEADNDEAVANSTSKRSWSNSDRADMVQIHEAYLSRSEVRILPLAKKDLETFLRFGSKASDAQYQAARKAILQTQTAVYGQMQDPHFVNFKKSDLWYKLLASDVAQARAVSAPSLSVADVSVDDAVLPTRPTKPARINTAADKVKATDLKRSSASTSDLKSILKNGDGGAATRRSMESSTSTRAPLFDDDPESDPLARSVASLRSDGGSETGGAPDGADEKVVNVMHAALNTILDERPDGNSLFAEPVAKSPQDDDSARGSFEMPRPSTPLLRKHTEKPSIASLGLIGDPARRGFLDDNIFGEEEKFLEDEREDSDAHGNIEDEIQPAAPGDLGLAEAIDALTLDIEKLVSQEAIIDSLTRKAELTNNVAELRILKKSKSSIQREINRKELQRQQYIVQESDNSLYGKAAISIQSVMVGQEEDGKEYALYIVEVRRQAAEHMSAAAWAVAHRYSEFHSLNKRLKSRYPVISNLEFPRRQVMLTMQKDFLQKRRTQLERWLQELLKTPAICRSRELRAFLSQQSLPNNPRDNSKVDSQDFVTRIYNSVTDGMEEFLGNIPVLDQLSLAGQNLISAATTQLNATAPATLPSGTSAVPASDDLAATSEAEAELRAFDTRELEPFVKPICDLFLEIFELNRENNWLRGRAVVVVLHQLLGGTIERKVREVAKTHTADEALAAHVQKVVDMMWPNGIKRESPPVRTSAEKARSRTEAGVVLASLIPELVGSVVGRQNAQAAARRLLATLNNQRLNTHLVFSLLDELLAVLFGDVPSAAVAAAR